ncbi:DegT/DnrJ/EryC1/StrS family aminotransferase [Paraburkholderia sp. BL10I2N1]|uniref:DegT/DnrJ/EryC1/StrS family aminotransferase n=1 Tax=Paraburkholderia sp. BL10I2N1 TaxID=1938796 RepID=UPI00105C5E1D|nr:DegT/DnrJ/EryC1/StrS family aminotransferase [Paraburkholderia sp. BL10I2N1]TDN68007.1 dTDP-4-amino-4,6-dideoxygalactose transaminase [Paraburkholderia sp. BL10I2N1]
MTGRHAAMNLRAPAFAQVVAIGQYNMPSWDRYEAAMRDIFERRYYTNQGPLARAFEERLQDFVGVRHAVCVTNEAIGLMMASEALGVRGSALVPAVSNAAALHAMAWCGVEAVVCDVDSMTGQMSVASLAERLTTPVGAVFAANLWGGACAAGALEDFAHSRGLPVLFDSAHAFGCEIGGRRVGTFGQVEVLAFSERDVLNAGGGACVTTDDDELAARLRNIRSSYGAGRPVAVVKTSNGRMSEAQAAIGLLSLDDYAANRAHNRTLFDAYRTRLDAVRGLRVVEPASVDVSNHQALMCEIDEQVFGLTRDALIERLAADNVEARPVIAAQGASADISGLTAAAHIGASWLMLPVGAHVSVPMVDTVCEIIGEASSRATHAGGERS